MGIEEKLDKISMELVLLVVLVLIIIYSMYVGGMLYFPGMSATPVPNCNKSNFMAYTIQGTNPFSDGIIDNYKTGGTYYNRSMEF
jgi:hypothetical protein